MAEVTKNELKYENSVSFPNNNSGEISPADLRNFNVALIDSTVNQTQYTSDSGSFDDRIYSVEGSVTNLNTYTASTDIRLNNIESTTQSLEFASSSFQSQLTYIGTQSSSWGDFSTASFVTTSSFEAYTESNDQRVDSIESFTSSQEIINSNLESTTASLESSISNINSFTESQEFLNTTFATTGSNSFDGNQIVTGSVKQTFDAPSNFTQTDLITLNNVNVTGTPYGVMTVGFQDYGGDTFQDVYGIEYTDSYAFNYYNGFFINGKSTTMNMKLSGSGGGVQASMRMRPNAIDSTKVDTSIWGDTLFLASYINQMTISGSSGIDIEGPITFSLEQGQMIVGDENGRTLPISTGSFAITGSNTFQGNQIVNGTITANGNIVSAGNPNTTLDLYSNGGNYDTFAIQVLQNSGSIIYDYDVVGNANSTWLQIPTNTGNNPKPLFTRGLAVSGSIDVPIIEIGQQDGDGINFYQNSFSQLRFWSGSNKEEVGSWVNMQTNPTTGGLSIAAFPHNYHFVHFEPFESRSRFEGDVKFDASIIGNIQNDVNEAGNAVFFQNPEFFNSYYGTTLQWRPNFNNGVSRLWLGEKALSELYVNAFSGAYDNIVKIGADSEGGFFSDWDLPSYGDSKWLKIPQGGTPQFQRGLQILGSVYTEGSVNGNVGNIEISDNTASLDFGSSNFFTLTLVSGSDTRIEASNVQTGQTVNLKITQPSEGVGTISYPSEFKFPEVAPYSASIITDSVDIITFVTFDDTSSIYSAAVKRLV